MVEFEDAYVRTIEALNPRREDAVAHHSGHGIEGVVVLFVQDAAARGEFLLRLPVVGTELKYEAFYGVGHRGRIDDITALLKPGETVIGFVGDNAGENPKRDSRCGRIGSELRLPNRGPRNTTGVALRLPDIRFASTEPGCAIDCPQR